MSDIKSVIKLLCHILNTITKINLKAEHFRLGKFNIKDTNCTEILWQVIHKLACVKALDEEETCAKDIVDCVILSLCDLHYTHAYRLSVDACNRELLFALSWLLANGVLAKHLNYHIYKSSLPLYCEFTQSQKIEGILKDNVLKRPKFKSYEDEVNYILLVAGKIKQNVKAISNFSMERASICSAVVAFVSYTRYSPWKGWCDILIASLLYSTGFARVLVEAPNQGLSRPQQQQ